MTILQQDPFRNVFGTFPLKGDDAKAAITTAMEAGYRAFDTAQMYENEQDVGAALKASGMPRDKFCIITKVHPDNYAADKFADSVARSLERLDTDYADLLLLHWPPTGGDVARPTALLAEMHERGPAKHIGVSNFTIAMMEVAQKTAGDIPIAANQVEFHPLLDQSKLHAGAARLGIPLMSYCAMARGEVFKHELFAEIAARHGKTAGAVVLRWILQKGVTPNAMSTKPQNINGNFGIMDFALDDVDMARIDALTATGYRVVDKGRVPWVPDWD